MVSQRLPWIYSDCLWKAYPMIFSRLFLIIIVSDDGTSKLMSIATFDSSFFASDPSNCSVFFIFLQSVTNLPPSGESLKILARDLGNRIYTKYCVRQKQQNQIVEKLGSIYSAYTDLLAKDTKVKK